MKKDIHEQLSDSEYKKFGTLFRCSDTDILVSKLTDVLKNTLPKRKQDQAQDTAIKINSIFLAHFNEIEIHIDFYESHEAEGYDEAKKINSDRLISEKKFEKNIEFFQRIKNRSDRYQKKVEKIGHNVKSLEENRREYPLYPPPSSITEEDINALKKSFEKFLHWDVFLSSEDKNDPNIGHPYLYMDLTSKIGAGGLDITAQKHNQTLTKKLAPILSEAGLSTQKTAIIIWAHQYFISQCYNRRFKHTENFFIPALSSLFKDVEKAIKNKT